MTAGGAVIGGDRTAAARCDQGATWICGTRIANSCLLSGGGFG
jgi:hypothetical protein